ncbi:MarR family winged helix-turn-helix transcriptional regulator [Rhodovulum sp. DZ06]|uniref:MarR family winged helix-turn-helix transcriptional regulator n=1 Tax=Rhodovulum sp. DZ06 TaxID=3425126 RepID=UPI003D335601
MEFQDMAGHVIRRLHQASSALFQSRMKAAGFDLTPVQFAALDAVAAAPGIDQAGVAARIAYDRATIGGVIDRMERKGLLAREVSRRDRRARELRLTRDGEAVLEAARPVVRGLQDEILSDLDDAERVQFLALARKAAGAGAGEAG